MLKKWIYSLFSLRFFLTVVASDIIMCVCGYIEERRRWCIDKSLTNTEKEKKKRLVQTATVQLCIKRRRRKKTEEEEEEEAEEEDGYVAAYLPDLFRSSISVFTYQSSQENERPSLYFLSYRNILKKLLLILLSSVSRPFCLILLHKLYLSFLFVDIHTFTRSLTDCIIDIHRKKKESRQKKDCTIQHVHTGTRILIEKTICRLPFQALQKTWANIIVDE